MRRVSSVLAFAGLLVACAESAPPPPSRPKVVAVAPIASTGDQKLAGAHFDVVWKDGVAVEADAKRALERGE